MSRNIRRTLVSVVAAVLLVTGCAQSDVGFPHMEGTSSLPTESPVVATYRQALGPTLEEAYRSAVLGNLDVAQQVVDNSAAPLSADAKDHVTTALAAEVFAASRRDAEDESAVPDTVNTRFSLVDAAARSSDDTTLVSAHLSVTTTWLANNIVTEEQLPVYAVLNSTTGEIIELEILRTKEDVNNSTIGE